VGPLPSIANLALSRLGEKESKVEKWLVMPHISKNYEKEGEKQCENGLKNER
jgi:hypothetical protein